MALRLISEKALNTRPPTWPGLASQVPIILETGIPEFEWDIANSVQVFIKIKQRFKYVTHNTASL